MHHRLINRQAYWSPSFLLLLFFFYNHLALAQDETENLGESRTLSKLVDEGKIIPFSKKNPSKVNSPIKIYGWLEHIKFININAKLRCKLDTGAKTSSLHVENETLFEKDGEKWVRFSIIDPNKKESQHVITEAPLHRIAKVKSSNGQMSTRNVVILQFKIGEKILSAQFTLNDRSDMLYPVLLGRRAISMLGFVDSSRSYLSKKNIIFTPLYNTKKQ